MRIILGADHRGAEVDEQVRSLLIGLSREACRTSCRRTTPSAVVGKHLCT